MPCGQGRGTSSQQSVVGRHDFDTLLGLLPLKLLLAVLSSHCVVPLKVPLGLFWHCIRLT